MDITQFISSVSGVLLGVIATFGLEIWYQNRAQRESAKFEVLKVI